MNKVYEVKTLEEAKKLAVSEFGICEEDIEFSVIKENKGFLGIGAKLEVEAKVIADGIEKGKQYIQTILDANEVVGFIEKKVRENNVECNIDAGD